MADYRTIKDLPGLKVGAIFRWDEKQKLFLGIYAKEGENSWSFSKITIEGNKDWFEEVK